MAYHQIGQMYWIVFPKAAFRSHLFINDLLEVVPSAVKTFANDTKIFQKIASDEDHALLQTDLNNLYNNLWEQMQSKGVSYVSGSTEVTCRGQFSA